MKIKLLQTKNPDYCGETWADYHALYKGGKAFRDRVGRFLHKNPQEHAQRYKQRKMEAPYRSYLGTVVNSFTALIGSSGDLKYTARIKDTDHGIEAPDWAQELSQDCDGSGRSIEQCVGKALNDSLVRGRHFWMLDFPENFGTVAGAKSDAIRAGATDIKIRSVLREDVMDWSKDDRGQLEWVVTQHVKHERKSPSDERGTEVYTWHVLDRKKVTVYEAEIKKGQRIDTEKNLPPQREIIHNLDKVPMVSMDMEDGLWIADMLESAQLEHFRSSTAQAWSLKQTAYTMPVFSVEDPKEFAKRPPTMGAGFFIAIGKDESADFMAPPTQHLASLADAIKANKDEIFRLVQQMALGVENNATAVGRSAESKIADSEATQVILGAMGKRVRDALHETLTMLSQLHQDDIVWSVEGLSEFQSVDTDVLLQMLSEESVQSIRSDTFHRETEKKMVGVTLPSLDKTTRDLIDAEIEAGKKTEPEPPGPPKPAEDLEENDDD